jgi:hypothetical protein
VIVTKLVPFAGTPVVWLAEMLDRPGSAVGVTLKVEPSSQPVASGASASAASNPEARATEALSMTVGGSWGRIGLLYDENPSRVGNPSVRGPNGRPSC